MHHYLRRLLGEFFSFRIDHIDESCVCQILDVIHYCGAGGLYVVCQLADIRRFRSILAEKLETVISRSDQNTRPRDYYDVYILTKLQAENIDFPALGAALMATASKRGSDSILQDYRAIVETVRNSEIMRRQWDNYRKDFDYASTISFDEVCDAVASTMDTLITNNFFN